MRPSAFCATVGRIPARRPNSSREPSYAESSPSPHVSLSSVTSHSPRRDAPQQAKAPRRWAIRSVLSRDCRLLRANGGIRRRFAGICAFQKESRGVESWFQGRGIGRTGQNRTLREERAGRPSAERRETGGRGSPHAPRRTRGARSRLCGDEAPHGDSRMRAAGSDARRTGARPRTARKREGATRRTRPGIANAARFGAVAERTACRTWRVGQDCGLRLTSRSPHGRQDAQVARPEAGAPLPRSAPHVGKRQVWCDGPTGQTATTVAQ